MIAALLFGRGLVSALILTLTALAFLPAEAASRLTSLQKFLGNEIERRRDAERRS